MTGKQQDKEGKTDYERGKETRRRERNVQGTKEKERKWEKKR